MSQVPAVGKSPGVTSVPAINSNSLSGTISQIIKAHGLDDVLLAKIDGGTGSLKIDRKLNQGQPKPLSSTQQTNLPACVVAINGALSQTKITMLPASIELLGSLAQVATEPSSSDTGTFASSKTSTSIVIPSPAVTLTQETITGYRTRAAQIIQKHCLTGVLEVDLRKRKVGDDKFALLFIVTNPTSNILNSHDAMLGLDRALQEISKTVLHVSYNFIDDTPGEINHLKKMYRLIRNPEAKK